MENSPCKSLKFFKQKPEKIFVSHSSEDNTNGTIGKIGSILEEKGLSPYIAERNSIGTPLTGKLRQEMADSNMVLVVWTEKAKEKSSEIIAFETGMAWLNQLPIFILKEKNVKMDWFYPQLTDYVEFENTLNGDLKQQMDKFDFDQYKNPICFCFPKKNTPKKNSMNESIVQDDGSICLSPSFNGIIHFVVGNHTNKIIRDIRVDVQFPRYLDIYVNPGGQGDGVQRNEMFDMKKIAPGRIRLMMLAMPSDEHWSFEVRVCVPDRPSKKDDVINVTIQGGEYTKKKISIPLKIENSGG